METRIKAVPHVVSQAARAVMWLLLVAASTVASAAPFTLFESGQVRPLALSPSGRFLYAVNTPDNRLEVFQLKPSGLLPLVSIPVGHEQLASKTVGFLYLRNGRFKPDHAALPPLSEAALRQLVSVTQGALTYTYVPPGAGPRIGIDRNLNGVLDGDEP